MQIYEVCNLRDLTGQRIAKMIDIMLTIEEQLAAMLTRGGPLTGSTDEARAPAPADMGMLNGPKLDNDSDLASQGDIDAMFS